jgi:Leucine-rich repeat (LRR) protein
LTKSVINLGFLELGNRVYEELENRVLGPRQNAAFKRLPASVTRLKKLYRVDIRNTALRELPEDFGALKNLVYLVLCCNELEKLPDSMARLEKLKTLHLGGNRLTDLPAWIRDFEKLEHLTIGGNPLKEVGRSEKGEYVDYYIAHRIWGDHHVRIWETGETESLETFSVMFSFPEEVHEIGGRLRAKGFSPTY